MSLLRRANEPGTAETALALGEVLERRGDLDGAEAAFRSADDRGSPEAARSVVRIMQKTEERDQAEAVRRLAERFRGTHDEDVVEWLQGGEYRPPAS